MKYGCTFVFSSVVHPNLDGCFAVQRLLKQGTDTLRSPQYQLLYVDNGVLRGQQLEDWKVLKAAETY